MKKIITAIKNWARGKPSTPLRMFIGKNHIEVEIPGQENIFIQPPIVRFIIRIIKITKDILKFILKEWRTIIPIVIALFSLAISIAAFLATHK